MHIADATKEEDSVKYIRFAAGHKKKRCRAGQCHSTGAPHDAYAVWAMWHGSVCTAVPSKLFSFVQCAGTVLLQVHNSTGDPKEGAEQEV